MSEAVLGVPSFSDSQASAHAPVHAACHRVLANLHLSCRFLEAVLLVCRRRGLHFIGSCQSDVSPCFSAGFLSTCFLLRLFRAQK